MYRFITDTPSGLSQAQAQQIGVDELVASFVRFGDEQFRETLDITLEEFHAKFKNTAAVPTTSAPSVGDFQDVYEKYKGDTIISIHLSRDLSGTVSAAENAAQIVGGDIHIIDSRNIAAGQVLLIQEAIALARAGKTPAEIKAALAEMIPRVRLIIGLDTLDNLKKGGRVGGAQAFIGGLLQFKPLLAIKDGKLAPLERVRTAAKVMPRLKELALQDLTGKSNVKLMGIHTGAGAEGSATELANDLAKTLNLGYTPMIIAVGASVATHAGPGAFGLAYLA